MPYTVQKPELVADAAMHFSSSDSEQKKPSTTLIAQGPPGKWPTKGQYIV
jgi:hypothetical protein